MDLLKMSPPTKKSLTNTWTANWRGQAPPLAQPPDTQLPGAHPGEQAPREVLGRGPSPAYVRHRGDQRRAFLWGPELPWDSDGQWVDALIDLASAT